MQPDKPTPKAGSKTPLKPIATNDGQRRFPIDDVKDALSEELALVRARMNQEVPDNISVKVFVIEALEEIMSTRRQVVQSHLVRILKEIKEDYRKF